MDRYILIFQDFESAKSFRGLLMYPMYSAKNTLYNVNRIQKPNFKGLECEIYLVILHITVVLYLPPY